MLIGKRFRLRDATVAVDESSGEAVACSLPKGAILKIVNDSEKTGDRFVDVVWQDRLLSVFLPDLEDRGEAIAGG